jgi:hypothetical protein
MTEAEWMTSTELIPMLELIDLKGYDRKFRLFSCACVRRVFDCLPDVRSRRAVEVLELHIDGLASWAEVEMSRRDANEVAVNAAACLASEDPIIVAWKAVAHRRAGNPINQEAGEREARAQCNLLRDIFGNPFRPVSVEPAWRTSDVMLLAKGIYDDRAFDRMPILADALQDAGCASDDVLTHLRDTHATHVRGCWALDLVLGKV